MADRGFHTSKLLNLEFRWSLTVDTLPLAMCVCSLCCEPDLRWYNLASQTATPLGRHSSLRLAPHNIIYTSIDAQSPLECKVKQHLRNFWVKQKHLVYCLQAAVVFYGYKYGQVCTSCLTARVREWMGPSFIACDPGTWCLLTNQLTWPQFSVCSVIVGVFHGC